MPNISKRLKFMAWFKFGKSGETAALSDAPVETAESLRTRAKRRLIGALVLVLTAVIGFPMLFDTQPRPVLVDVPIEIPDKAKARPLTPPAASTETAPSIPAPAARVEEKASLQAKEEIVPPGPAISKPNAVVAGINTASSATKSVAIATPAPDTAAKEKAATEKAAKEKAAADKAAAEKAEKDKAAAAKAQEAARAQALLEGKTNAAVANGERFIVQFGSFAEEGKAREVRQKVERAGLKTYAQVATTSEGKRHRVRVGPFATRAEAEKAASKIKSLDLPAAILTL
jgi:DedD protein